MTLTSFCYTDNHQKCYLENELYPKLEQSNLIWLNWIIWLKRFKFVGVVSHLLNVIASLNRKWIPRSNHISPVQIITKSQSDQRFVILRRHARNLWKVCCFVGWRTPWSYCGPCWTRHMSSYWYLPSLRLKKFVAGQQLH